MIEERRIRMKKDKGITLIALVITIVVLLIISTIGITTGTSTYRSVMFQKFTTEMKLMQTEINQLYQDYQKGDESILTLGKELTNSPTEIEAFAGAEVTDTQGYRYFDKETLQNLGIEEIDQAFLVNIEKRSFISYQGFEYRGIKYYTVKQLPDSLYNVEYENQNTGNIIVENVKVEAKDATSWQVVLEGIRYPGYIEKGTIQYQKSGNTYWNSVIGTSFVVEEPGIYFIKITDATGNEKIVNSKGEAYPENKIPVYAYVKDGLTLYLDAQQNTRKGQDKTSDVWEDLSGNQLDATLSNFNQTATSGWQEKNLKFDGIDDYGTILNQEKLKLKDQTIEIVIKKDRVVNNDRSIFFVKWTGYTMEFISNNTVSYGRSRSQSYLNTQEEMDLGKIYSILGSHSNSLSKIYFNNVLKNTQTVTIDSYNDENLTIGMFHNNYFLAGEIYQIRMYERELTQQERNINYSIDKIRYGIEN